MGEISTISGIQCYEVDGVVYLNLETVARGLGFTTVATSGNEVVRWQRVRKYLCELGVPTGWHGDSPPVGKDGLPEYIPENIFYRLAMKAKNETAERFQALVADEVIPAIRRTGRYQLRRSEEEMLSMFDATQLPGKEDYIRAASITASCRKERLPYVFGFLKNAGLTIERAYVTGANQLVTERPTSDWRVEVITEYLNGLATGKTVCVKQIVREALEPSRGCKMDITRRGSSEITHIMNDMPGWERLSSTGRMGEYGIQRGWRKVQEDENETGCNEKIKEEK